MSNEDFAKNPNTPAEALAMLSTSPSDTVRLLVAGNPSTPVAALRHLALDENKAVREAVSRNPKTPYDAFTVTQPPPPSKIGPASDEDVARVVQEAQSAAEAQATVPQPAQVNPALEPKQAQVSQPHSEQADSQTAQQVIAVDPSAYAPGEVTNVAPRKSLWQRILGFFGLG